MANGIEGHHEIKESKDRSIFFLISAASVNEQLNSVGEKSPFGFSNVGAGLGPD